MHTFPFVRLRRLVGRHVAGEDEYVQFAGHQVDLPHLELALLLRQVLLHEALLQLRARQLLLAAAQLLQAAAQEGILQGYT